MSMPDEIWAYIIPNYQLHLGEDGNTWDDCDNGEHATKYISEAKHKLDIAKAVQQAKLQLADDIIDMLNKEARDPAGKGVYRWHVPLTVAIDKINIILNAGKTGEG